MIVLAIDTCDFRGSVAVLRHGVVLGLVAHETSEEYSSWLLPAVNGVLRAHDLTIAQVDGFAVASGPGSFTGVRIGLTAIKAWSEVYGKPVAAVSRLEAIAVQATGATEFVASFADAQRGQVFGAVYHREVGRLMLADEEMVIAPGRFVQTVAELTGGEEVAWVSPDPAHVTIEPEWKEREHRGERVEHISAALAAIIGQIGSQELEEGKSTDALGLDANYVRRSDAEIFWKGAAHGG